MCLYPRQIVNKKYTGTKKNTVYFTNIPTCIVPEPPITEYTDNGIPIYDDRVTKVSVGCGQCIECRRVKAAEWRARITEELSQTLHNYFVTFTFSPEELDKLCKETKLKECNAIAGIAVRRFLERFRKQHKVSLKHWLITELGHNESERIHLHGIIFSSIQMDNNYLESTWKYGHIWMGNYCNLKTINYIVKYVTKIDDDHKGFVGKIFCSPGIGKEWLRRHENDFTYKYTKGETKTYYRLPNGAKTKLPTYYRRKIWNDQTREEIWRDFLDKDIVSIMGNNYVHPKNSVLKNVTNKAIENNKLWGFGDNSKEYQKKDYNITKEMITSYRKRKLAENLDKISKILAEKKQKNLVV